MVRGGKKVSVMSELPPAGHLSRHLTLPLFSGYRPGSRCRSVGGFVGAGCFFLHAHVTHAHSACLFRLPHDSASPAGQLCSLVFAGRRWCFAGGRWWSLVVAVVACGRLCFAGASQR